LERLNNSGPLAALWASRRKGYVDAVIKAALGDALPKSEEG